MTRLCLSLLTLLAVASPVSAQPPGAAVRGEVRDASGAIVPGATVTLAQSSTNLVRTTTTAPDGQYVIPSLPPGQYRLEIAQAGFKTYVESFELFVSQDLRVDVALHVGAPAEQVLVEAPAIALERDCAAVSAVIDNGLVVNLPLDGRNFLELALLSPGTAPAAQGSASSVRGDFAFTATAAARTPTGSCSTAWTTSTRS